jgi:hypothetical protein
MPAGRAGQAGALRVTLVAGAFGAVLLGAGLPGPGRRAALAQEQPITDRDYVLDLYQGPVLGAGRMVSMGGAAVALAEGSASMLVNPAAPAIRLPTSIDEWDWDWHADWLDPSLARDYDNDGRPNEIGLGEAPLITLGAIGQYRGWGLGTSIVMGTRAIELGASSGGADQLTSSFVIGRVILAHAFERPRVTVGLGVRTVLFDVARTAMAIGEDGGQERSESRYAAGGASLEAGAVWQPVDRDLRVGAAVKLAVQGRGSSVRCDPATCDGPVPPRAVNVPWEVALGFAWRWGPTRWNRRMAGPWRDERALILTGDVVFTGPTHDGHAYEAFLDEMLRPSGRDASVSVRAGAEHEWLPGRLRVRGGSYWEPGRVEGANGRLHVTTGLEWRFWQFRFRDEPYRLRFSLTADVARDYRNGGVSIGLWH